MALDVNMDLVLTWLTHSLTAALQKHMPSGMHSKYPHLYLASISCISPASHVSRRYLTGISCISDHLPRIAPAVRASLSASLVLYQPLLSSH